MKTCLNKKDFHKSSIFDELTDAARVLGYETISDMLYSEYQTTGNGEKAAIKLGFSKDTLYRYLKIMGVKLRNSPISYTNRRHIISLFRRGYSAKHCARLINRNPTTTRRTLLRKLGPVEYRQLSQQHRRNIRG